MPIEWYPGHMAKARRQIAEMMRQVDVVIEILDARLPTASANPLLRTMRGEKPCIKLLNKSDLADPAVTREWVQFFEREAGVRALPIDAREHAAAVAVKKLCRRLAPHRGKPGKPLRALVVGIPNVGKSTLINTLAGRRMARVGDRPAITTCQQQIDLRDGIFLYDTPGLLWPDMRDQRGAYRLAASGAIGEGAIDAVDVALFALEFAAAVYPDLLASRYRVELPAEPAALLAAIGRRRGCLVAGGEIDRHRAADLFLRELRGGLLGRISLERPGEPVVDSGIEVTDAAGGLPPEGD